MAKLYKYIIMISGIELLFYFSGLLPSNAPTSVLLSILLNPSNIANSLISTKVGIALGAATVLGTITIGFYNVDRRLLVAGPFALFMLGVMIDFLMVIAAVSSFNPVLAILIFSPLLFALYFTIVSWVLGQDT